MEEKGKDHAIQGRTRTQNFGTCSIDQDPRVQHTYSIRLSHSPVVHLYILVHGIIFFTSTVIKKCEASGGKIDEAWLRIVRFASFFLQLQAFRNGDRLVTELALKSISQSNPDWFFTTCPRFGLITNYVEKYPNG